MSAKRMAIGAYTAAWTTSVKKKLDKPDSKVEFPALPTIYRVPETIRRSNRQAYEPEIVSIGPYHRRKKRLQGMEKHKRQYLHEFLSRNRSVSLECFHHEVKKLEEDARSFYSEDIPMRSCEFAEMMVLDGCFIIELFLKLRKKFYNTSPIYGVYWVDRCVARDVLLAENQLPFVVLRCIYSLSSYSSSSPSPSSSSSLETLAMNYFRTYDCFIESNSRLVEMERAHHLLHLVHSNLLSPPPSSHEDQSQDTFNSLETVPLAKRLQEVGVKLKKKQGVSSLDIKFSKGKMEIPNLFVDDYIDSLFRNLIVFEQICPGNETNFTAYVAFMDYLVNTSEDIEVLHKEGILAHELGSNEKVAKLFNRMCRGVFISFHSGWFFHVTHDVILYYNTKWRQWMAMLFRNYFGNPWLFISFLAATTLLVLTFIQTI